MIKVTKDDSYESVDDLVRKLLHDEAAYDPGNKQEELSEDRVDLTK
jgi:hypothetical protein